MVPLHPCLSFEVGFVVTEKLQLEAIFVAAAGGQNRPDTCDRLMGYYPRIF